MKSEQIPRKPFSFGPEIEMETRDSLVIAVLRLVPGSSCSVFVKVKGKEDHNKQSTPNGKKMMQSSGF